MKNIEDIYDLSPMQEGMLFHALYAPESGVYCEQLNFTLYGPLNVSAFKQAWQQIVARHPVLRSSFYWEDLDKPVQVVNKRVELVWTQHDWRDLALSEQTEQLEIFQKKNQQQVFLLDQAPLMRFGLIQVSEKIHQFVWGFHHLLIDGWSWPIVFKELFACYEALNQGQRLSLAPVRPYRDYITWLKQQNLSQAKAYWQQSLQGFAAPTPLGLDRAVSELSDQQLGYDEQSLTVSATVADALRSLAKQHRLTLNTLFQGVWALLLSHYSGESDVLFGATVSGRSADLPGVESIVGLCINTLPVRTNISRDTLLLSWLQELQAQQVERERYSYTPLAEIQGWSELPGATSLFESILVFENYPVDDAVMGQGGSLKIANVRSFETTNYPLTFAVIPGRELCLRAIYDQSRFGADTITRMMGHFQTLLGGIAANPEQKISQYSLLTSTERHQLLVGWNNTHTDYPRHQCIHQLFEQQVERTPDAIALTFEHQQLTYRELNTRANQLAHHLQSLGVGPECLVGICMDRSLDTIVGLLGILKAGGVYVPLDPAYPPERLAFMLEDTQVSVLVTQQVLRQELPDHKAHVVCLDADRDLIAQASLDNPSNPVTAENLAYIMYTSGSTGRPKGVCVTHRGVVRLVKETNYVNLSASDVFLQLAPISFDAATFEIWGCLLNGARLALFPGRVPSLQDLGQAIQQHQVTILLLTAGLFHLMVDERLEDLKPVRQLLAGGDVLSVPHVQKLCQTLPDCQLINGYGPTENTTFTCCYALPRSIAADKSVPIGRPIANTQIYILDHSLKPLPMGVVGELYIGGDGLARGYLNRPDLTDERFILNPLSHFDGQGSARLYKTGDLVRYLPDGNVEFLGRVDNQVKIRGFRIELGEIEAALSQHPAINQAVLSVKDGSAGDKRLVAYLVCESGRTVTVNKLRSYLTQKLPDYMMPSALVFLEAFPLNPNGKVNRRALPEPDLVRDRQRTDFV
ncbi:MAG: amino acid adenylation domain-containing protein, partial [Cyanobacteria bacterium P01_F01_bin.4]